MINQNSKKLITISRLECMSGEFVRNQKLWPLVEKLLKEKNGQVLQLPICPFMEYRMCCCYIFTEFWCLNTKGQSLVYYWFTNKNYVHCMYTVAYLWFGLGNQVPNQKFTSRYINFLSLSFLTKTWGQGQPKLMR